VLNWLIPAAAALAILLIACRVEIVTLLYKRKAFDARAVLLVSQALLGLGPGILGLTLVEIFHRAMVLRGRLAGYLLVSQQPSHDALACYWLVPHLGILGVTLGASIAVLGAGIGSSPITV